MIMCNCGNILSICVIAPTASLAACKLGKKWSRSRNSKDLPKQYSVMTSVVKLEYAAEILIGPALRYSSNLLANLSHVWRMKGSNLLTACLEKYRLSAFRRKRCSSWSMERNAVLIKLVLQPYHSSRYIHYAACCALWSVKLLKISLVKHTQIETSDMDLC